MNDASKGQAEAKEECVRVVCTADRVAWTIFCFRFVFPYLPSHCGNYCMSSLLLFKCVAFGFIFHRKRIPLSDTLATESSE